MSHISIVLEKLMAIQGLTEAELARRAEVKQPVISRILNEDTANPRTNTLESLAEYFEISVAQLLGDEPIPNRIFQKQTSYLVPILPFNLIKNWLQCRKNVTDHQSLQWIPTDITQNENAFAVLLESKTMAPMLPSGSILIFEPNIKANDGDYVVIEVPGIDTLLIKELVIDGPTTYLRSPNPDVETIRIRDSYKVLGVMLQARINFKQNTYSPQENLSILTTDERLLIPAN